MKNKDTILLENAYDEVRSNQNPNNLNRGLDKLDNVRNNEGDCDKVNNII
jgi:hypothetical protein